MEVSQEELDAWFAHPITQAFKKRLMAGRQRLMEAWADGVLTGSTEFETAMKGAVAIAQCKTALELLDLEPMDFKEL